MTSPIRNRAAGWWPVTVLSTEREAITYAYKNAKPGSFITIMCDVVPDALAFIKSLKEEEEKMKV